jgi:hypothetical protein
MTKLWVVCPLIRFAPNQINEPPHGEYIVNYSELTLVTDWQGFAYHRAWPLILQPLAPIAGNVERLRCLVPATNAVAAAW